MLVGEVEDEDVEDEEEEEVVVGKTALTILPTSPADVEVAEDEEDAEDTEDAGVLSAVVAVDADCVSTAEVIVGLAPAPLTGWGVPGSVPIWGARFLRKRLWVTW